MCSIGRSYRQWQARQHPSAFVGGAVYLKLPGQTFDTFAHTGQAQVTLPVYELARIKPRATVCDIDHQIVVDIGHIDRLPLSPSVSVRIIQRLLHHSI